MTVLWQPSPEQVRHANLTAFRRFVTHRHGIDVESYADLHAWSIAHIPEFWDAVWDFCEVIGDKGDIILDPGKHMLEARFFPDARSVVVKADPNRYLGLTADGPWAPNYARWLAENVYGQPQVGGQTEPPPDHPIRRIHELWNQVKQEPD